MTHGVRKGLKATTRLPPCHLRPGYLWISRDIVSNVSSPPSLVHYHRCHNRCQSIPAVSSAVSDRSTCIDTQLKIVNCIVVLVRLLLLRSMPLPSRLNNFFGTITAFFRLSTSKGNKFRTASVFKFKRTNTKHRCYYWFFCY